MILFISFFLFFGISLLIHRSSSKNQKLILGILVITIAIVFPAIFNYLKNLGTDSFTELQKFDNSEALFFLMSIKSILFYFKFNKILNEIILLGVIFLISKKYFGFINQKYKFVPQILLISGIALFTYQNFKSFQSNSSFFKQVNNNFHADIAKKNRPSLPRKLLLIVYIGESTSASNMQIYGYQRNTTPKLSKLASENSLIVFPNVLSTHTHTTPSLLEALSVAREQSATDSIENLKRASISDVLDSIGINTYLFSNQGYSGSFNLASPIIFNKSKRNFSLDLMIGNNDSKAKKPFDYEYFKLALDNYLDTFKNNTEVVFLHSYAGHGNYLKFIPEEFRHPIDNSLAKSNPYSISTIATEQTIQRIEDYDSAMTYIDDSLNNLFKQTDALPFPTATIYFSDHGDSVYSGSGHDSSRANIYNFRVPLVMHFNTEARKAYPEIYSKYQKLSQARSIDTLDKLPTLILDLLGFNNNDLSNSIFLLPNFGEQNSDKAKSIFVRKTNSDITKISLSIEGVNKGEYNDIGTGAFIIDKLNKHNSLLCFHGANNYEGIARANITTNCHEFDLVVNDDALEVYHPPKKNIHLTIESLINERSKSKHFWIDSKNANNPIACHKIADFLTINRANFASAMVEFPHSTDFSNKEISSCISKLNMANVEQSFYLNTGLGKKCLKQSSSNKFDGADCNVIKNQIEIAKKYSIRNISYDIKLADIVDYFDPNKQLIHNTWSLYPEEITPTVLKQYKRIIYKNNPALIPEQRNKS